MLPVRVLAILLVLVGWAVQSRGCDEENMRPDAPRGSGEEMCQGHCMSEQECLSISCCYWENMG